MAGGSDSRPLALAADALRADFVRLLDAICAYDGSEGQGAGPSSLPLAEQPVQAVVASLGRHALRLQQAFAASRWRTADLEDDDDDESAVREEIARLRLELEQKERLLSTHRERLVRWQTECAVVQSASQRVHDSMGTDPGERDAVSSSGQIGLESAPSKG